MVGAVGLTLKRPVAAPDYDVFAQHYVDFQKGLVQIKNKLFLFYFILFYLSMRTEMKKLRGSVWEQPV
jgi:hypothetical protein